MEVSARVNREEKRKEEKRREKKKLPSAPNSPPQLDALHHVIDLYGIKLPGEQHVQLHFSRHGLDIRAWENTADEIDGVVMGSNFETLRCSRVRETWEKVELHRLKDGSAMRSVARSGRKQKQGTRLVFQPRNLRFEIELALSGKRATTRGVCPNIAPIPRTSWPREAMRGDRTYCSVTPRLKTPCSDCAALNTLEVSSPGGQVSISFKSIPTRSYNCCCIATATPANCVDRK